MHRFCTALPLFLHWERTGFTTVLPRLYTTHSHDMHRLLAWFGAAFPQIPAGLLHRFSTGSKHVCGRVAHTKATAFPQAEG